MSGFGHPAAVTRALYHLRRFSPAIVRNVIDLQLLEDGYLRKTGWTRARRERAPVDAGGKPIPWYRFAAIRFLEGRARPHFRVFEFGTGNSTLWWSDRSELVVSREHDAAWAERIKGSVARPNVHIELIPVKSDDYVRPSKGTYQLIVIDGRRRLECATNAVNHLTHDGVILWDNSDRDRYSEGYHRLHGLGFRRLDFWGLAPGSTRDGSTSIFYREGNCLGI